jgi:outer membrane protein OmpA-like peptidoglycan-associated protein
MRIYDPRVGRFLSVDPISKDYPELTPYQFAGNKPIWAIDMDGLEEYLVTNYYDLAGRLEETTITVINNKETQKKVKMKLQNDNGNYLAKKNVLIRNVYDHGRTVYKHSNTLDDEQKTILKNSKRELIEPKVSPFGLEGGGKIKGSDGGSHFITERDDYTNDKYLAAQYSAKYSDVSLSIDFIGKQAIPTDKNKAEADISVVANQLKKTGGEITINGYVATDDKYKLTDEYVYNNGLPSGHTYGELAKQRAEYVRDELIKNGVDKKKIKVVVPPSRHTEQKITITERH